MSTERKRQFHEKAIALPATGFVRLQQIIGNRKRGIPGPVPVCASAWWKGVKEGRFPKGVKLSARVTVWRVEDIRRLVEEGVKDAA